MNTYYDIDHAVVYDLYFNQKLSLSKIGHKFSVGPDAIRGILKRNGWETRKPYKQKIDHKEVIRLYNNGVNGPQLAEKYNADVTSIYKILHQNNINIIQGERNRKYSVNENFFSKWSPLMAYWLGMLCADGHLDKNNHLISLSMKDIEHLKLFASDLDSKHILKEEIRNEKSFSPGTIRNFMNINSIKIKKDLIKLEFLDFKIGGIELINKIPNNLFNHWLRGMTDGDGTITIINSAQGKYPTWRLVGPYKEQLQIIGEKASQLSKITKLQVYKSNTIFVITCKKKKCLNLLNYLYKNNIQSLSRKRQKFETIRNKFYTKS